MLNANSKTTKSLLNFFFSHEDESFYVNELARRLELDRRNLFKKLKELEDEGLFHIETMGNLKLYSLNKQYPLYAEYKKIILKTSGVEKKIYR